MILSTLRRLATSVAATSLIPGQPPMVLRFRVGLRVEPGTGRQVYDFGLDHIRDLLVSRNRRSDRVREYPLLTRGPWHRKTHPMWMTRFSDCSVSLDSCFGRARDMSIPILFIASTAPASTCSAGFVPPLTGSITSFARCLANASAIWLLHEFLTQMKATRYLLLDSVFMLSANGTSA